jgi:cation:H+ antiporter
MVLAYFTGILLFSLILIKATQILLVNLGLISAQAKVAPFFLSGLVVALATSLPELFVGIIAAIYGHPNLSLGNVVGSNIAALSLVIGGVALVGGAVAIKGEFLYRDVFYAFLAGAVPMVLLFDKVLSRVDGLILLALYGFYQAVIFSQKEKNIYHLKKPVTKEEIAWLLFSIVLIMFCANMVVRLAIHLAVVLNIQVLLIGLILVSIGTTLPELIFEFEAIQSHQPEMALGNLLGSIVTHSCLVLGVVALITPIRIAGLAEYLLATMAFVVIFGVFYLFVRTKKRLDHWEGAVLILIYLAFVIVEFIQ